MRIGMGYDVHRLIQGRDLVIGGVKIPYEKGLDGHSDADVLLHAIMDALLGAAGLGDIGKHFPDTDERYRGISSVKLLECVADLIEQHNFIVGNIDATIIAQAPKMRPYIPDMEKIIADTLGIEGSCVNIKATTEEGLGFTGKGEGISACAVCLLESVEELCQSSIPVPVDDPVRPCGTCGGCIAVRADKKEKKRSAKKDSSKKDKGSKKKKKKK